MFEHIKEAIEHLKFYSSGATDDAAIHCIEVEVTQFTYRTNRWSLNLAMAIDSQDWGEVSRVCGQINKVYCDLAYCQKEVSHG